jgi:NADH:ubiquinone oxidoreductase subunit 6 (subunit J)
MTFGEIIFILTMLVTLFGALSTAISGSMIYALMSLIVTMFGISGLYIYLNAPFIAMMQILIYVGAICILLVFAVMIAGPHYLHMKPPKGWSPLIKLLGALFVPVFTFFVFVNFMMGTFRTGTKLSSITTKEIGRALFDSYTLPFELISLLIVVSIIGAVMLALFSSKGGK